jgi:hypothetical protein
MTPKRLAVVAAAAAVAAGVIAGGVIAGGLAAAGSPAAPAPLPALVAVPGQFRSTGTAAPADAEFNAVSCTSAVRCTVVGDATAPGGRTVPLAERWNGRVWRVEPIRTPPDGGSLESVSCVAAGICTAVGYARTGRRADQMLPLAESSRGGEWVSQKAVVRGVAAELTSVSCTTATFCMALGSPLHAKVNGTLMERWDGHRWTQLATPGGRDMASLSCTAPASCVAAGSDTAGDFGVYSEAWDGSAWGIQADGDGGSGESAAAVSCTSPAACTVVGSGFSYGLAPTAERWDGARWRGEDPSEPSDADTDGDGLGAVSCVPAAACFAVGSYSAVDLPDDNRETIAEKWNGSTWMMLPTPRFTRTEATLTDISCTSATACMAVGETDDQQATGRLKSWPLAERWNGRAWTVVAIRT